jgi:hypothetical protein
VPVIEGKYQEVDITAEKLRSLWSVTDWSEMGFLKWDLSPSSMTLSCHMESDMLYVLITETENGP